MSFFFFQAEDGIRDIGVTGVQTCALPIYWIGRATRDPGREALLVLEGVSGRLPPEVDDGVVGVEPDPEGGWWLLLRDLGDVLLPADTRLRSEEHTSEPPVTPISRMPSSA